MSVLDSAVFSPRQVEKQPCEVKNHKVKKSHFASHRRIKDAHFLIGTIFITENGLDSQWIFLHATAMLQLNRLHAHSVRLRLEKIRSPNENMWKSLQRQFTIAIISISSLDLPTKSDAISIDSESTSNNLHVWSYSIEVSYLLIV